MSDIAALEAALVKADAAGNAEDAKRLADAIRAQRTAAPEKRELGEFLGEAAGDFVAGASTLAGGVNQAAFDLLDAPSNIYNLGLKGLRALTGSGSEGAQAPVPSESRLLKTLKQRGTARAVPEGENALLDAGRTGLEWASGGAFTKGSKVPDLMMGGGAALGEYVGGDTGEVIGGITGLLAGGKNPRRSKAEKVDAKTVDFMRENAENFDGAMYNLQRAIDNGETGTLADLTKDRGIFNVETDAVAKGSNADWGVRGIRGERNEQIVDEASGVFGSGDSSRLTPLAAQREMQLSQQGRSAVARQLDSETTQISAQPEFASVLPKAQAELTSASDRASAALDDVAIPSKPSQASADFSDEYARSEKAFDSNILKPAWEKFSGGKKIATADVTAMLKADLDKLNKVEADILNQKFGSQISLIRGFGKTVAPDEVQTVVSQIKAINRNARKANDYDNANRLLEKLGGSLENSIMKLGNSDDYTAALAATQEKFNRFAPTRIGEARGLNEPRTFGQRTLDINEGGAEVGALIRQSNDPNIVGRAEDYIKSIAGKNGVDQNFLDNYDELLDSFPDLKQRLNAVKSTQDELVSAQKGIDAATATDAKSQTLLTKTLGAAQKTADKKATGLSNSVGNLQLSKLREAPKAFLDKALKGESADLEKLSRQMGRVDGGTDALRAAVRDRFVNSIKDKQGVVTTGKVADFHTNKRNLVSSGILTKDEVAQIERVLERVNVTGLSKTAGARKTEQADGAMVDILASGGSVVALGVLPAQNQLLLAGTVRRLLKNQLGQGIGQDAKVLAGIENMITNPKKFLDGMVKEKIMTEKALEDYTKRYINAVSQSVAEDEQ